MSEVRDYPFGPVVRFEIDPDPRFSLAQAAVRDTSRLQPKRLGAILTDLDPPEHTRLRRLVSKAFTARRVAQLQAWAQEVATELLDALVVAGGFLALPVRW